jgi:hypothetical protein
VSPRRAVRLSVDPEIQTAAIGMAPWFRKLRDGAGRQPLIFLTSVFAPPNVSALGFTLV